MSLAAAFVRVSTGSQDEASQVEAIDAFAEARGITIIKTHRLRGYSASAGAQEPALREVIREMQSGEYSALIVTDSSRLDRREDLDKQAEILLAIRAAGGDVLSVDEPEFGRTDFTGRIVTLVAQQANAEKSRKVKNMTFRGISMVRDNRAHLGNLPVFWESEGPRYRKQAKCVDVDAVVDIFERIANGSTLSVVGRAYDLYPASVRRLIRFAANHTGVIECHYSHDDVRETWAHEVEPVVDSAVWWRANNVLDVNRTDGRGHKGGRPVAQPANWLSGLLPCPGCGGKLHINTGTLPSGEKRTPKLRCGGNGKKRIMCGRFTAVDALPVIELVEAMFRADTTDILEFQRVAGNAHELYALKAELPRRQARLAVTEVAEMDALVTEIKELNARIMGFEVVPDRFDYAPTGQTVAQRWEAADAKEKRAMVSAVRNACGMALTTHEGGPGITIGTKWSGITDGIVDLGGGLCFRRKAN